MRPTSTPPCDAGLSAIRASTSTSPRPRRPGSTWSSACSPTSPVVACVEDTFAVSPNSNQRSDATSTTATPLPNRSSGPKGPTPSFENTNGLSGTLFHGRDTRCAVLIIQAGIKRVVARKPDEKDTCQWAVSGMKSIEMFKEAEVDFVDSSKYYKENIQPDRFSAQVIQKARDCF